jgi:Phospholipase_D-nuclease N-terminal
MAKKKWSDLQPFQQRLIIAGGAAEAVMTFAALRDLFRRPSSSVRGPKALWVVASVVQPFGPLAYFAFGRR